MADQFTEYQLPETAYTTFDAESLRSLIIQRLNEQGTFTDQVYRGSNMSSYIDVIAYSYHVLMYYLNRTSSESIFTESSVYENVNRIVKMLNYNPIGTQTSMLKFNMFATENLIPGVYSIPRYTYITTNNTTYTLGQDASFTKMSSALEPIDNVGDRHLLYEGQWVEHREITSLGQDFETHVLIPRSANTNIDHFHVHVYVKDPVIGRYHQFEETSSLYFNGPDDRVFEKRLNENEAYELRFGNNITGTRLEPGSVIQVYYLESHGEAGEVGPGFLDGQKLIMYSTTRFNTIKNDIKPENVNYISYDDIQSVYFTNSDSSTSSQPRETVEQIKRKAPIQFASQDRLVTLNEFRTYMDKNFGNMLTSSQVVDNEMYVGQHMRYFREEIGIDNPDLESRIMFNHLNMSTSTHFNNVYIYCVPKMVTDTSTTVMANFINPAQRELILNSMIGKKMISHELVLMDPVYVAASLGVQTAGETDANLITGNTTLEIQKDSQSLRDDLSIKQQVLETIVAYFHNSNCELGQLIDLNTLGSDLLQIDGVTGVYTVRNDLNVRAPGISLIMWNPVYPTDLITTNQNLQLPYFKFPYLYDSEQLREKIIVTR